MRLMLWAATAGLAASLAAHAQQMPPEIQYDSVPDFFKLPENAYFGEVAGIAVNSKKHIFVLSRGNTTGPAYGAAATQLLEFDQNGKFVREIGKNLYAWAFAHTVRVDKNDDIWVSDKGSDMVIRFDPAGRVKMVFGRKPEASDESAHPLEHPQPPLPPIDGQFRQVTDVAWDSADNIYISDGYINSRVAKYDKDGNWLASYGSFGAERGQFNTLHSIAIDARDRVYVADRGNRRIQVLDTSGKVLDVYTIEVPVPPNAPVAIGNRPAETGPGVQTQRPGAPWAICITPPPNQVMYVSDSYPGRIYKMSLDGKVLGWLGGSGKTLKKFGWIHEIACPSENELYVAELLNWRAQKLLLR
jgi:DNA-binding beta-propeller fold protein YncE